MKRILGQIGLILLSILLITTAKINAQEIAGMSITDARQTTPTSFEVVQSLGRGKISTLAWDLTGENLAVASSQGIWFYTIDQSNKIHDAVFTSGHPLGDDTTNTHLLSWNTDGSQLASAVDGNEIIIWDVANQTQAAILNGHTDTIRHLAWSPDNIHLVSSSYNDTGIIWTWNDGTGNWEPQALAGHTNRINQFAWNADGSYLASASDDSTVRIWKWNIGTAMWESDVLPGHSDSVMTIAWDPSGQILASGSRDGDVRIWMRDVGANTWQTSQSYKHDNLVLALAWNPNGNLLASSDNDGRIMTWNTETNELEKQLPLTAKDFEQLFWLPTTNQLISSGEAIYIWDADPGGSNDPIAMLNDKSESFVTALRPHTDQFISVGQNVVYLWNENTGSLLDTMFAHNGVMVSLDWNPDGTIVGGSGDDTWVRAWDVSTGEMNINFPGHVFTDSPAIAWNSNWTLLAAENTEEEALVIYDWQQVASNPSPIEPLPIVTRLEEFAGWLVDATWSKDQGESKFIGVTVFSNQYPLVFNTGDWALSDTLDEDTNIVQALTVEARPNQSTNNQVAIGGIYSDNQGFIQVWDLTTNSQVAITQIDTESIDAIAWNPEGTAVAGLNAAENRVYLWNINTQDVTSFEVAGESLYDLAWSSSNLLAVSSLDKLHVWDMSILAQPLEMPVSQHSQTRIIDLAWSRDGSKLASSHTDGSIKIWR